MNLNRVRAAETRSLFALLNRKLTEPRVKMMLPEEKITTTRITAIQMHVCTHHGQTEAKVELYVEVVDHHGLARNPHAPVAA